MGEATSSTSTSASSLNPARSEVTVAWGRRYKVDGVEPSDALKEVR